MSTQSLVRLPTYRMSHHHDIHTDTSQAYQLNPTADYHQMHPLQVMHDHPDFMTDLSSHLYSVWSHSISWTYGSSPLAACTRLHASLVGLWSLLSFNLITSTDHLTYVPVLMQHDHLTLWSDMHDTLSITSPKPAPIIRAEM